VHESGVIHQPIDRVWEVLRPLDFSFQNAVARTELEAGASSAKVGGVRRVTYRDGTLQRVKLVELSDANHSVTYDVIESTPAVRYMSAIHTVRLTRITSVNHTLVECFTDYSKDADASVILDSKFKKLDFIKQLGKASEGRATKFFRQLNFARLDRLTTDQVDAAWRLFDRDGNGVLDTKEIGDVIDGLLARLATEQASIVTCLSNMFADADDKEIKAEDVTDGMFDDLKKRKVGLARELAGKLDVNKDGKVDYAEFKLLFGSWLEEKLTEGIAAALT
jgi:Ca2+-binding EF-hand superfamily protein